MNIREAGDREGIDRSRGQGEESDNVGRETGGHRHNTPDTRPPQSNTTLPHKANMSGEMESGTGGGEPSIQGEHQNTTLHEEGESRYTTLTMSTPLSRAGEATDLGKGYELVEQPGWVQDSTSISVNASTNSELPYVQAVLLSNTQRLKCLIDSGSSANILSSKVAQKAPKLKILPSNVRLTGINQAPVTVCGEASLFITIEGEPLILDVIVADIAIDLVLGNPFIIESGATVNLRDKILTLPDYPGHEIPINVVEQATSRTASTSRMGQVEVSRGCIIEPNHGKWIEVTNVGLGCPNEHDLSVVVSQVGGEWDMPTQRVSSKQGSGLVVFNHNEEPIELREGQVIGEYWEAPEHIPLKTECNSEPQNSQVDINLTLDITPEERESRWDKLCKVLGVNKWNLTEEERNKILIELRQFEDVFALSTEPLGLLQGYQHTLEVGNADPISQRPRPLTADKQREVDSLVQDLLDRGLIRPSKSPWSSPICLVRKTENSFRLCIDYRLVNKVVVKDSFPLPNINNMLSTMKQSKYFSSMDLMSGYHQIAVRESDIPITAFCTPTHLYEFLVLPFGITTGPASFARALTENLKLDRDRAKVFFDDILALGETLEEHWSNLSYILRTLQKSNLRLKAKKCFFFAKQVEFLGHTITEQGIKCTDSKIEGIQKLSIPKSPTELRSVLGIMGYYRRFVENYSSIAKELHRLTTVDRKEYEWTAEADVAFNLLKEKLTSSPILTLPRPADVFTLTTDCSKLGMGAVLSVTRPEGRRVIAYASHVLEKSRSNYGASKLEMYAVVTYVQYFKFFLMPQPFTIESDHKCLQFLATFKDPAAIVARWIAVLSEYQYTIVYKPGTSAEIRLADVLSRNPIREAVRENENGDLKLVYTEQLSTEKSDGRGVNCEFCENIAKEQSLEGKEGEQKNANAALVEAGSGGERGDVWRELSCNTSTVEVKLGHELSLPGRSQDQVTSGITTDGEIRGGGKTTAEPANHSHLSAYMEKLKKSQQKDVDLAKLKSLLSTASKLGNPTKERVEAGSSSGSSAGSTLQSPVVKFYMNRREKVKLEEGILWYADSKGNYRIMVPRSRVKVILKSTHDHPTAGHRSSGKMLPIIRKRFHWYKMKGDIQIYTKCCESCGGHKAPRRFKRQAPIYMTKTSARFERISIDIAGPFTRTKRNNRFLLVGVCCFSKFAFACAVSSTDSEHLARILIDRYFMYFGFPTEVHSDAASNLIGSVMTQFHRLSGIKKN